MLKSKESNPCTIHPQYDIVSGECPGCFSDAHKLETKESKMPKVLIEWLKKLSDEDAEEIWIYLDETQDACNLMIEVIAESHEDLTSKLCGPSEPEQHFNFRKKDW